MNELIDIDDNQLEQGADNNETRQSEREISSDNKETQLSQEENQALERFVESSVEMGICRTFVIQAWLVCDRSIPLSRNYLLENIDEIRSEQAQMRFRNPGK